MKWIVLGGLFFVFFINQIVAQQGYNHTIIRDYKYSLALKVNNGGTNEHFTYSVYGKTESGLSSSFYSKYLYQGQELLSELDIYLFPYRTYSGKEKRFQQPDPKSQYFSPYLFVGSDPVNFIDHDGNVAKPLVLYALESQNEGHAVLNKETIALSKDMDAHYMSLPDILNGNFKASMPDWSGDVFIETHAGPTGYMASEVYTKKELVRTDPEAIEKIGFAPSGKMSVFLDKKALGKNLSILSEKTGVPVRSIVTTGCHGNVAARGIAREVLTESAKRGIFTEVKTVGLKRGYVAYYHVTKDETIGAHPKSTNLHLVVAGKDEKVSTYKIYKTEGGGRRIVTPTKQEVPVLGIDGIRELSEARVPGVMKDYFDVRNVVLK